MSIKIVFSPDNGQLYGAQIVGFDGVDKRIEMLAQVIQRKGTVYDLTELEQAYAPPYFVSQRPRQYGWLCSREYPYQKSRNH